jgi:hypothetical protein
MGGGKCNNDAHMNKEANRIKCWAALEIFCEVLGFLFFTTNPFADLGFGSLACLLSIIGYSVFSCCSHNNSGFSCMVHTVRIAGFMRLISFCFLVAYIDNVDKWEVSCINGKHDCWNGQDFDDDGLTRCYSSERHCIKKKEYSCTNSDDLYSGKVKLYSYGRWNTDRDSSYETYYAAKTEKECRDYNDDVIEKQQDEEKNRAVNALIYTILLAIGQIILVSIPLQSTNAHNTLLSDDKFYSFACKLACATKLIREGGVSANLEENPSFQTTVQLGPSPYVHTQGVPVVHTHNPYYPQTGHIIHGPPVVQGQFVQGQVVQGQVVQGQTVAGTNAAAVEEEHPALPTASAVGVVK